MQTQPSRREPTVPVEDDEDEERENSTEEGENEEPTMATKKKRTTKTKKTKRAREGPQLGITRVNEDGELEWFPKADREGGKTSLIRMHFRRSNPSQSWRCGTMTSDPS